MKVKLLAHTPDPDFLCAVAAFTSWKKWSAAQLFKKLERKEAEDFLRMVLSFGHESVSEHATFTFSIEGVSRACTHQLVRHRLASYTQQSQRYVKFRKDEVEYVTPPSIASNPELVKRYEKFMRNVAEEYEAFLKEGIPPEDARFLLPNAATTNIVVTMNARELNHFFRLRCCERTQWELRKVAEEMLKLVKKVAPVLFEKAGPGCVVGPCPEGKLTCGKIEEIREKYRRM